MNTYIKELNEFRAKHGIKVDDLDTYYMPSEPKKRFYVKVNYMPENIKTSKGLIQWTGICTDGVIRTYIKVETNKGSKWVQSKVAKSPKTDKEKKRLKILEMLKELEA